jgi:hypothetical protein
MLVHMNGRVYDPAIGRFLSADPFIDCAGSTQGWNRYSYVKNSPLALKDPSGFSSVATRGMSVAFQVRRIEFGPKGDGGARSGGVRMALHLVWRRSSFQVRGCPENSILCLRSRTWMRCCGKWRRVTDHPAVRRARWRGIRRSNRRKIRRNVSMIAAGWQSRSCR